MKYKIATIADLVFGILILAWGIFYYTTLYSKIVQVYADFGSKINPSTQYLVLGMPSVLAVAMFLCAYKIHSLKGMQREPYFIAGLILIVVSVFVVPAVLAQTTLLPMFNLVNVIN